MSEHEQAPEHKAAETSAGFTGVIFSIAAGCALLLAGCSGGGGDDDPTYRISAAPATVTLAYGQGAQPSVELSLTLNRAVPAGTQVVFVDTASILASTPLITPVGAASYSAQLEPRASLAEGRYTGSFELRLCTDTGCSTQLPGSPVALPYDIVVGDAYLSSLLPYLDEEGIKLLDPRFPLSATNPRIVDAPPTGEILDFNIPKVLMTADWDGVGFSNLRPDRMVYVKDGTVFSISLQANHSPIPTRISSINTACRVLNVFNDYQDVSNARLLVRLKNDAGSCQSGPQVRQFVGATADAGTPASTVGATEIKPLNKADGSLAGFLAWEAPAIVRRDANFADPQTVLTAYDNGVSFYHYSSTLGTFTDTVYFASRAQAAAMPTVYRYAVDTGTLTPLATYSGVEVPQILVGAVDAENFYFDDWGSFYRVPHNGTSPVRMNGTPPFRQARYAVQTSSHVVFAGSGTDGVFSLAKTAVDADPTRIPGSGHIVNATPEGLLLIQERIFGASSSSRWITWIATEDGTLLQTLEDTLWTGPIMEGAWNPLAPSASRILLADYAGPGSFVAIRLYDARMGTEIADLGALITNTDLNLATRGFGRYLGLDTSAHRVSPSRWDRDAFFVDTEDGLPPQAVLTDERNATSLLTEFGVQ